MMESKSESDIFGSCYAPLPAVPEELVDRTFLLSNGNVEITSMDIAPHGAFVVVGTSSGMVLLFDMSNPYCQKDGLLIGQIRARGMHTNLILTVKFSEDGRFVFAGVSKGSSEMLAIDLGKVLVDWNSAGQKERIGSTNREASETLQQLQLQSMVTFSFSDAKLRGFGAVVRMDHPQSSEGRAKPSNSSFSDSSALYRLACGRGIKNVHIWHFTVGYLLSNQSDENVSSGGLDQKMMHGKWEYVCDVASNGNTITHIEFRQSGNELISKSAGMSIRVWDLRGNETLNSMNSATESRELDTSAAVTNAAPTSGNNWMTIKPTYSDISNSQDVKCLLPVGTGAYGGTYQFAVLNTSAPKEANRDVLELPERFSGDAAAALGGIPSNASSSNLLRGRRITREIEQVICTDEGAHALLLCADGGVVYYGAPSTRPSDVSSSSLDESGDSCADDKGELRSSANSLLELPVLFRQKDLQQHTGSWALRRVGRQGLVVLLRAYPEAGSAAVVVEARLLVEHLPVDAGQRLLEEGPERINASTEALSQMLYYLDSSVHAAQEVARGAWRAQPAAAKRSVSSTSSSALKTTKKPDFDMSVSKKKSGPVNSGEKSPRSFSSNQLTQERRQTGAILVTPVAPIIGSKVAKLSPFDATERLISDGITTVEKNRSGDAQHAPIAVPVFRSSRISGRQVSSSSFAKLRALRDDDSSAGEEEHVENNISAASTLSKRALPPSPAFVHKELCVGPAPKVRRIAIAPFPAALATTSVPSLTPVKESPFALMLESWNNRSAHGSEAICGLGGNRVLGSTGLQRLGIILMEQDRLKAQFVREVGATVKSLTHIGENGSVLIDAVIKHYRITADELVLRQQLELQGACAIDSICNSSATSGAVGLSCWGDDLKVVFRHENMFLQAAVLRESSL